MESIAVIGAGRIGRIHAGNVAAQGMRLKYVVDTLPDAAASLAARCGAQVATLDAVMADRDVKGVVIASATGTHLDYSLRAIAAGKAVFCEKPLDMDLARARGARDALGKPGTPFFLAFNRRFDPNFEQLRERVAGGSMGTLESLHVISHDPAPPPIEYVKVSGGLFKDMAIHDFDMARWLLAEEPVEVYAAASCLVDPRIGEAGDVDTAKVILRTAGGRICVISNSRRSGYGYDQRIEAFCAKGLVSAGNVLESTVATWSEGGASTDRMQNFFLDRYADAYRREMAHFAGIVRGECAPRVGYGDGVAALALAEAAARSVREGAVVRVGI